MSQFKLDRAPIQDLSPEPSLSEQSLKVLSAPDPRSLDTGTDWDQLKDFAGLTLGDNPRVIRAASKIIGNRFKVEGGSMKGGDIAA